MGKRVKNFFIYLAVRSLFGLMRLMGFARAKRFGRWAGRVAFKRAKLERRRTLAHLAWAFEERSQTEREALARAVFEHLGCGIAEVVCAHKIRPITDYMELDEGARLLLDDVLAKGRGVVFITGHVGNWELMARTIAASGYPVNTIGQKSYDPRLTRLLMRFRDEGRVKTLWRGEQKLVERMVAVLRKGEIMGLLIDQDTKVPGTFVPFFGKLAWTPTAGALLARKTGAPVVLLFNHRKEDGSGYLITAEIFSPIDDDDLEKAVAADTAAMTSRIEDHIRAHPAEWVWMHRRWKTRPEDESSV